MVKIAARLLLLAIGLTTVIQATSPIIPPCCYPCTPGEEDNCGETGD